jgi:hypothetical protein
MTQRTLNEIYEENKDNYKKGSKKEKQEIIDLLHKMTGMNRKSIIRKMNLMIKPKEKKKGKKRGRKQKYDDKILIRFILDLWRSTQYICSRRLRKAIALWLPHYNKEHIPDHTRELLNSISSSTIDRILSEQRKKYKRLVRATTKPGSILKKHIPIHDNKWDTNIPGYVEADTVAHCGESVSGSYAISVVMTDIATGWTEIRAVWGKGQRGVHKAIENIELTLPFRLFGFDSDNGNEFLNYHLYSYFDKREHPVKFTRSRAYQKNDNAHVEQKNWSIVRSYIGYGRFDKEITIEKMNDLYCNEFRIMMNYFIPSEKMLRKERHNGKLYKIMTEAKSPYQKLREKLPLSQEEFLLHQKVVLENNPYELMKVIERKIKAIYRDYTP